MKTYSCPKLLLATVCGLGCIFACFAWRATVDESTFLARKTLYTLAAMTFIVGSALFFSIKKWGKGPPFYGIKNNLKVFAGSLLMAIFFSYILVITVVWLIPGTITTYSAPYVFSGSGRHSCSGADVDDPDLNRRIKVCEPVGNYFGRGTMVVTKRSNALGMTVIYAATKE